MILILSLIVLITLSLIGAIVPIKIIVFAYNTSYAGIIFYPIALLTIIPVSVMVIFIYRKYLVKKLSLVDFSLFILIPIVLGIVVFVGTSPIWKYILNLRQDLSIQRHNASNIHNEVNLIDEKIIEVDNLVGIDRPYEIPYKYDYKYKLSINYTGEVEGRNVNIYTILHTGNENVPFSEAGSESPTISLVNGENIYSGTLHVTFIPKDSQFNTDVLPNQDVFLSINISTGDGPDSEFNYRKNFRLKSKIANWNQILANQNNFFKENTTLKNTE